VDPKRIKMTGKAISVRGNDVDTDRIIPARYLKCVTFDGLGEHAFEDDRAQLREMGQTHPLDDSRFAEAEILFVNKNFGCGSSREHAPQALMRWGLGIKAIVGESFAEIFFGNCVALGIPCCVVDEATMDELMRENESDARTSFVVDIETREVKGNRRSYPVTIPAGVRQQFIDGRWDMTAELLAARERISATASSLPYFGGWKYTRYG